MDNISVEIPHFYMIEYREGDKCAHLDDVDIRDGINGYIPIWPGMILSWEPPYDELPMTDADRQRIVNAIYQKLKEERGFPIVVVHGPEEVAFLPRREETDDK